MSDDETKTILRGIEENLRLIAEAILQTGIGTPVPAFVKVAQDVLEVANEKVGESVVETVKNEMADEPMNPVVEEVVKETSKPVKGDLDIGARVVYAGKPNKSKGLVTGHLGVIVDNPGTAWIKVQFEGISRIVPSRKKDLRLVDGEDAQPPVEEEPANEPVPSEAEEKNSNQPNEAYAESPKSEDPSLESESETNDVVGKIIEGDHKRFREEYNSGVELTDVVYSSGAYASMTVAKVYGSNERGKKFVIWTAKAHKDETIKAAAQDFLKAQGVEW